MNKQDDKILKFTLRLIKKTWANILNIRSIIKTNEKYLFVLSIIITIFLKFYFNLPKMFFIFIFQYFVWKAIFQIIKEDAISLKYKGLSKLFDNKVKVIEAREGIYKLNSFVSLNQVKKRIDDIEHYLNRKIIDISRDNKNYKLISVETISAKEKAVNMLSKTYLLEDYITKIKKEHEEIFFLAGMNDKGKILKFDLMKLTHTFIAGMQGGGKSNLLNVMIQTLMYFNDNIFYIMCDFKGGVELSQYEKFKNTILIDKLKDLEKIVDKITEEMDERYKMLRNNKIKKIKQYNDLNKKNPMPYIVFIIDEMSDIKLSLNSESLESKLTIILNKGRACGIIGILATQRPGSKQVSTDIRDRTGTKISARIVDTNTQVMAGIKGTESLKDGEFMMKFIETLYRFKAFFIDDINHNKVYEILSKKLEGGKNVDIFIKAKKE